MSKQKHHPIARSMYGWTEERCGDFIIFVESQEKCHKFLYIPGAGEYYLTFKDFSKALERGILEFVEQLPESIFKECLEQSKLS